MISSSFFVSVSTTCYFIVCTFSSTRVSNEIGAGNVDMSKNAVAVTLKLSVFLAFSFVLLLGFGHGLWARLFSRSEVIGAEFAAITPLVMASIVLDSAQGVLSGEKDPSANYLTNRQESLTCTDHIVSYHGHEIIDWNAAASAKHFHKLTNKMACM